MCMSEGEKKQTALKVIKIWIENFKMAYVQSANTYFFIISMNPSCQKMIIAFSICHILKFNMCPPIQSNN